MVVSHRWWTTDVSQLWAEHQAKVVELSGQCWVQDVSDSEQQDERHLERHSSLQHPHQQGALLAGAIIRVCTDRSENQKH